MSNDAITILEQHYAGMAAKIETARTRLGRPLTLGEKTLAAHLKDPEGQSWERRKATAVLHPDRVAMQDATAQMALLQFALTGKARVADRKSVV